MHKITMSDITLDDIIKVEKFLKQEIQSERDQIRKILSANTQIPDILALSYEYDIKLNTCKMYLNELTIHNNYKTIIDVVKQGVKKQKQKTIKLDKNKKPKPRNKSRVIQPPDFILND